MEMKRILLGILAGFAISISVAEARGKSIDKNHFVVMSGYGYSYSSDFGGYGIGSVQTFLYTPDKCWGFGLETGYSRNNGARLSHTETSFTSQEHGHGYWYVGPGIYWFPVNTRKHQVHLGCSLNYSHASDSDRVEILNKESNEYDNRYWLDSSSDGVGFAASAGYIYKVARHVGIGARCYFSWYEEAHVLALLNLQFEF